jgi:hypothetical protein
VLCPIRHCFQRLFQPWTKPRSGWPRIEGRSLARTTTPVETIIESSDGTEFGRYHC